MKRITGFAVSSSLLLAFATMAWAGDEKLSGELRRSNLPAHVDVIVSYRVQPTQAHYSRVQARGGTMLHRYAHVRASHVSVPASALSALAADPDVAWIAPNRAVRGFSLNPVSYLNIVDSTVHADAANAAGWTGAGIGVAVIDSGMPNVPSFNGQQRIVYSQSFVGSGADDQFGHGTHVAAILGIDGGWGFYPGIAPGVNFINLKVLDQNGSGTDAAVIAAIDQAIALKSQYNIRVINMSLGRPVYEAAAADPLCQAVEDAWQAGIVVVVAAGNEGRNNSANTEGYATITSPGNDPYVITVGAMKPMGTSTRADDLIASYSSKGPTLFDHYVKPDLVAPGNLIAAPIAPWTTLWQQYPQNQLPGNEFVLSGTSMAAPVVSGAAALLIQQNPKLTPDQVKARLMRTASKTFPTSSVAVDPITGMTYVDQYDIFTVGAGYIDIQAALNDTTPASGSALSPSAVFNANLTVALQGVSGANVVWGSGASWASNVVWGTNAVLANNVVWGSNVVWGASGMQGFNVVWGTNVIWGTTSNTGAESADDSVIGEQ